jgi:hypothetical protein
VKALQDGDLDPVRQLSRVLQPGDGADGGIATLYARNQQNQPVAIAGGGDRGLSLVALDWDGHHHRR